MPHPDDDRLEEAHRRLHALPKEKWRQAAQRMSRSYSAAGTCVKHDGCTLDGLDVVWPDGERWPARSTQD